MKANATQWLTSDEAAQHIGVASHTLENWRSSCKKGQPKFYKAGMKVRYKLSDLDQWIEANSVSY